MLHYLNILRQSVTWVFLSKFYLSGFTVCFLSHTHTLGYNLTFQKRVSGFKTHQTAPAAKGINVWIVLFDLMTFMNEHYNVLHVE